MNAAERLRDVAARMMTCAMCNHAHEIEAIAATLGGDDKSRYSELFGTPERAARTLEEFELDQLNWCRGTEYCESCPYEFDRYGCYLPDGFELLEWLRGDA